MIFVFAGLCVALAAITAAWYRTSTRSLLAAHTRRTVIVTLKTSETFQGVLYAVAPDAVVLRDAVALAVGPDSQHHPVDGEVMILRVDVSYMQFA